MKQPQTPDIPGSQSTQKDCEELGQLPWDSIHIGGSQEMHRHGIVPAAKSDDCATSGYKQPADEWEEEQLHAQQIFKKLLL